jgi:hypothetical protein
MQRARFENEARLRAFWGDVNNALAGLELRELDSFLRSHAISHSVRRRLRNRR